jgi:hypothetical protein
MKKPLLIVTIISIALNCMFYYAYEREVDENQIKTWEVINLRGYKNAYMEHFDTCLCHSKCFKMK